MAITKTQIEKWNKSFNSLTKQEKRIKIAEDVIKQIRAKKYSPYADIYININGRLDQYADVQKNFDKLNNCKCCQLGACLLSFTKFDNKLKVVDLNQINSRDIVWKRLLKVFSKREIALMEYAFEGDTGGSRVAEDIFSYDLSRREIKLCQNFHDYYKKDNERMVAICKNIIKNLGAFKP